MKNKTVNNLSYFFMSIHFKVLNLRIVIIINKIKIITVII